LVLPKRHAPEPIELGLMFSRLSHAPIDVVGTFWFDATPQATASNDYSQTLGDQVHQAQERRDGGRDRAEEALDRAIAEHAGDLHSEALLLTNGGMDALASESHDLDLLVRGVRDHWPVHPHWHRGARATWLGRLHARSSSSRRDSTGRSSRFSAPTPASTATGHPRAP
jgi:hypothetical protein